MDAVYEKILRYGIGKILMHPTRACKEKVCVNLVELVMVKLEAQMQLRVKSGFGTCDLCYVIPAHLNQEFRLLRQQYDEEDGKDQEEESGSAEGGQEKREHGVSLFVGCPKSRAAIAAVLDRKDHPYWEELD